VPVLLSVMALPTLSAAVVWVAALPVLDAAVLGRLSLGPGSPDAAGEGVAVLPSIAEPTALVIVLVWVTCVFTSSAGDAGVDVRVASAVVVACEGIVTAAADAYSVNACGGSLINNVRSLCYYTPNKE